jgi:hypothetical protein
MASVTASDSASRIVTMGEWLVELSGVRKAFNGNVVLDSPAPANRTGRSEPRHRLDVDGVREST